MQRIRFARSLLAAAVLALALFAAAGPGSAQAPADTVQIQQVRLLDGSTLIGTVVEETPDHVVVVTTAGVRVEIPRGQVRSVHPLTRGPGGQLWLADVNETRLFFGPTGRSLGAGDGYVSVFQLFFPFVAYGVTDWLTLAGGTMVFPTAMFEIFYVAPKVRIVSVPGFEAGAGVLALFAPEELDEGAVGIVYGVGTLGSADQALTFGAGWGFAGGTMANRPALLFGGEMRTSRATKLLSENYLIMTDDETFGLLSAGIRFFGERLSADAGLALALERGDAFCCLPVVNFVYNF
jgi:hypothetical protein